MKDAKTTIIPANHVDTVKGVINNFETIRKGNPIVLTTNQNSTINFSDVINFDNSANKLLIIDIKNSTDNDLKSIQCFVMLLF